jgi:hypothetical protein
MVGRADNTTMVAELIQENQLKFERSSSFNQVGLAFLGWFVIWITAKSHPSLVAKVIKQVAQLSRY